FLPSSANLTDRLEPPRGDVQATPRRAVGGLPRVEFQPSLDIAFDAFAVLLSEVLGVIPEATNTDPLTGAIGGPAVLNQDAHVDQWRPLRGEAELGVLTDAPDKRAAVLNYRLAQPPWSGE